MATRLKFRLGMAIALASIGLVFAPGFLKRSGDFPSRSSLLAAANGADRIVVMKIGMIGTGVEDWQQPVFEVKGNERVQGFLEQLRWVDPPHGFLWVECFHCMCDGEYHLELYQGERLLVSLGYHHGQSIRWRNGPWQTDVRLTDDSREALPRWFAEQGFTGLEAVAQARDRQ